jgi:RNA-dependent RNA polymerase
MPIDICFDTLTPPTLEKSPFHRTTTGRRHLDNLRIKEPISAVDEGHKLVAAYSSHLRVVLMEGVANRIRSEAFGGDPGPIASFRTLWGHAGLPPNVIFDCSGPQYRIESSRMGFFERKIINRLNRHFEKQPWSISFQLEALLRNGLLHTGELERIIDRLPRTSLKSVLARAEFLRHYNQELDLRPGSESALELFERLLAGFHYSPPLDESFRCCHVTFTPTRTHLEGPYPTQSNRIIRQYRDYEEHFIRVDFRGEDGLQFHWDRETDPIGFLKERVGNILKHGFLLAGRRFEILAYSNSALRQHSVWFIHPFECKVDGRMMRIDGAYIRDRLGDFRGTPLLRCPSKYAARLSQAFTATHPSVDILREEWDDTMPDMGPASYLFTDGVGTISKAMGERIWSAYCKRNDQKTGIQPSAVSCFSVVSQFALISTFVRA